MIDGETSYPFDPARDLDALRDALLTLPDVRLLVIDPVVSAVSGDSHKNAEVRRGLQPLVDLAGELGCAILGITHFSKGTSGRDPVERITGSLAFGALARVVLVTARQDADDERSARRVLLRAKCNIGPDGGGFAYELRQEPLPDFPGIEASRAIWGEAIDGTAREVLAKAEAQNDGRSATGEAMDWLREVLAAGPRSAREVLIEAKGAGIESKPLRSARERLGIKPVKTGYDAGWVWSLPKMPERHEDALHDRGGIFERSGHLHGSTGRRDRVVTERRQRANMTQRKRRADQPRIDYYPSPEALAAIEARRTRYHPTNNYSGILDTILREWAVLVGMEAAAPTCSPPVMPPELGDQNARARISWGVGVDEQPELLPLSRPGVRARITSDARMPSKEARVVCGARRRRDGLPCEALSVPGKRRCKWHGGASTGPTTNDGRARSRLNLKQYCDPPLP